MNNINFTFKTESIRSKITFGIYHLFLKVLFFFLKIFKKILPIKIQKYLNERQYPHLIWRKEPFINQRRIWFHAASGEVEYIKPLLKLWKMTYPEDLLFLTYFSTSALDLIPRIPDIDGWATLPIDLPKPCQYFLEVLKPDILIISRTDLWPTILKTFTSKPKILVASTWSEGSKKTQFLGRMMSQWCIPYLNKICVVNNEDLHWIKGNMHSPPEIIITGDPRFDQVRARLDQKRVLPANLTNWAQSPSTRVILAGSTWEPDEDILFESITKVNLVNCRCIFVPHENTKDHLKMIQDKLNRLELPYLIWSEQNEKVIPTDISILIFDEKGWLAELYQLADFAFIGGSFKKQVHSVMEALGCGVPVLVGPYYKNNREAIEFSKLSHHTISFVKELENNSTHIAQCLNSYIKLEDSLLNEVKLKIRTEFMIRCGGTSKTFIQIQKLL